MWAIFKIASDNRGPVYNLDKPDELLKWRPLPTKNKCRRSLCQVFIKINPKITRPHFVFTNNTEACTSQLTCLVKVATFPSPAVFLSLVVSNSLSSSAILEAATLSRSATNGSSRGGTDGTELISEPGSVESSWRRWRRNGTCFFLPPNVRDTDY